MEDPGPNSRAGNQPSRGGTACHQLGSQPGGAQHDEGEVLPEEENVAEAFYNTREQGQSAQAGIPRRWELENGAGRQQDRTPWGDRHRGRAIPRGSTRASWQEHPKRAGSTPGRARAAERQNPAGLSAHFGSNHTAACANFRRALYALPHVVTFPFTHPPTHPTRLINTEKNTKNLLCSSSLGAEVVK